MLRTRRATQRRLERLLGQLHRALARVPAETRRELLLHRFTQHQRLALESWMLRHGTPGGKPKRTAEPKPMPSGQRPRSGSDAAPCEQRLCEAGQVSRKPTPKSARKGGCTASEALGTKQGIMVYHRGQETYSAHTAVEGIDILTRAEKTEKAAAANLAVLSQIRQRVLAARAEQAPLEEALPKAVEQTLAEHGITPEALGLRFAARLRCWVTSPLRTARYRASELEDCLFALRVLKEARGEEWSHRCQTLLSLSPTAISERWTLIKEAYTNVMLKAGCSQSRVTSRLSEMEAELQKHLAKLTERWNRAKELREQSVARAQERSAKRAQRSLLKPKRRSEVRVEALLRHWTQMEAAFQRGLQAHAKKSQGTRRSDFGLLGKEALGAP